MSIPFGSTGPIPKPRKRRWFKGTCEQCLRTHDVEVTEVEDGKNDEGEPMYIYLCRRCFR